MSNDINSKFDLNPEKILELSDSGSIEAYVHPVRIKIVKMLSAKKQTVSGVAKKLGVHPANITHHFKLLEKHGLIKIVERRDIGRNIEKYYRAAAYQFIVKPDKKLNKSALALSVLRNDLATAIETVNEEKKVLALLCTAKILQKDVDFFISEMRKLINIFSDKKHDEGVQYILNMSLYPGNIDSDDLNESIIID
jgi:DNA-binding transcriptional ArsR family regulator